MNKVVATDLFEKHPMEKLFAAYNICYIQDDMCNTKIKGNFDVVCCISTLEHLGRNSQSVFLENMIKRVKPGGYIIMTFDDPGFDELTDLELYISILSSHGFTFKEGFGYSQNQIMNNFNSVVKWKPFQTQSINSNAELRVYRLIARKHSTIF